MGTDDRLAVLMYHSLDATGSVVSVEPGVFAQQMSLLAQIGCRAVSLKEALDRRQVAGRWPERCVVVTFDDGFANVHEHAMPVLSKHGFGATVFLISGHVGGKNDWAPPPARLGTQRLMSWRQAQEMAAAGVEMGAHTRTHPDLRRLPDAELQNEVVGCRGVIQEKLGQPVETFAYPYGFVDPRVAGVAAGAYRAACTTRLDRTGGEPMERLSRIDTYYFRSIEAFRAMVEGRADRRIAARRWLRAARRAVLGGA